jgi:restriction system protein
MWGIHAGRAGAANDLFIREKRIAIGWPEMGDLSRVDPNREAFKKSVAEIYPNAKKGAIPVIGGTLYRFVNEMNVGDIVIYPSKADKQVHIGRIVGNYVYDPDKSSHYCNQRKVTWLGSYPRTRFSQGALYEIGSAVTLFQVETYADEFIAALEGKEVSIPPGEDETVAFVIEDIKQTTHDFIIKTLSQELKGHPFADFIAHLLEKIGYHTRVSQPGPDQGIDIIAHKDELGFEPPIIKVQVKSKDSNIGSPEVAQLYGSIGEKEFGLFVTLSNFTSQAISFAASKTNLRLIDGDELIDLILAYYEKLDSRYKGILPLKQVYIPEALPEQEE